MLHPVPEKINIKPHNAQFQYDGNHQIFNCHTDEQYHVLCLQSTKGQIKH